MRAFAFRRFLPVTVTVDPFDPRPDDVARYLAAIAARMDERPEPMRVVFSAPAGIVLDLLADGRLSVAVPGHAPHPLDVRHRWLADHPVPLALGPRRVLYLFPVEANRFRVTDRLPFAVPPAFFFALALVATLAAVCFWPWALLAAGLLAALGAYLNFPRR